MKNNALKGNIINLHILYRSLISEYPLIKHDDKLEKHKHTDKIKKERKIKENKI